MSEIKISVRYARALFEFAQENNILEAVKNDMELVAHTCHQSYELISVFNSSIIKESKKSAIIQAIFESKIDTISLKYLEIITRSKRAGLIPAIAKQFVKMYLDFSQTKKAHLTSAAPMDDASKNRLVKMLEEQLGTKIILKENIDESLIGGFVLRVGDKQFDSSIKNKVDRLKKEFDANLYIKEF